MLNYSEEWLATLKHYRANWAKIVYPFTFRRAALRSLDRFKQGVKDIPIFGPIIKDRYQKTKRNIKMGLYPYRKHKEKIPIINHFV